MTNPVIQTDIASVLLKLDGRFDKLEQKLDKLSTDVTDLKVGQAEIRGDIKTLDERLSGQIKALDTKVDQMDKRVGNQEFLNRTVVGAVIVALVVGLVKLFVPNFLGKSI